MVERVVRKWWRAGQPIPVDGLVAGPRTEDGTAPTVLLWGALNGLTPYIGEEPPGSLRAGEQVFRWPGSNHPIIGPDHPPLAGDGWRVDGPGENVPAILEAIALAVRFRLPIVLGYLKDGAPAAEERRLSEVRAKGAVIVAADADRGAARSFRLDRVTSVRAGDGARWPVWDPALRDYVPCR